MGVLLIILIQLMSLNWNIAASVNGVLPCKFQDSINITEGMPGSDGTITFDNLTFNSDQYAIISYVELKGPSYVYVSPHLRGCPCQIKPCIRLCCPFGKIFNFTFSKSFGEAYRCQSYAKAENLEHEIFDNNNKSKIINLSESFAFVSPTFSKKSYLATEYQIIQVMTLFYHFFTCINIILGLYISDWTNC